MQVQSVTSKSQVFQGKMSVTENGNPYYKSNGGLKTGSVIAVPAFLFGLAPLMTSDALIKEAGSNAGEVLAKQLKGMKKYAVPFALIAAGCSIGCGVIVDYLRNKGAKNHADAQVQGLTPPPGFDNNIEFTDANTIYYKNNTGVKYGAGLGAVCGIINSAMQKDKKGLIPSMIFYAIGGLIAGAIADKVNNNGAKKASIKQAFGENSFFI